MNENFRIPDMAPLETSFPARILHWYDQHGRNNLPWKIDPSPYRVWISEVMLQQTQVATVIPYFQRFMQRFPTIEILATAPTDEVLRHWSGLGYYARARNLHRAAKTIVADHNAEFPVQFDQVLQLPGIGRSTAGAILAQALNQRYAILDGNVKRVLARFRAVEGWPGHPAVAEQLWIVSEKLTPQLRIADYTQAIMDIGATVCTRTKPRCLECPIRTDCVAFLRDEVQRYPTKKTKKTVPQKRVYMAVVVADDRVLFEKRPPVGIWGGLWSFPEFQTEQDIHSWAQRITAKPYVSHTWHEIQHTFSHFQLAITPIFLQLGGLPSEVLEPDRFVWYKAKPNSDVPGGIATPVRKLLEKLSDEIGAKA